MYDMAQQLVSLACAVASLYLWSHGWIGLRGWAYQDGAGLGAAEPPQPLMRQQQPGTQESVRVRVRLGGELVDPAAAIRCDIQVAVLIDVQLVRQ